MEIVTDLAFTLDSFYLRYSLLSMAERSSGQATELCLKPMEASITDLQSSRRASHTLRALGK